MSVLLTEIGSLCGSVRLVLGVGCCASSAAVFYYYILICLGVT